MFKSVQTQQDWYSDLVQAKYRNRVPRMYNPFHHYFLEAITALGSKAKYSFAIGKVLNERLQRSRVGVGNVHIKETIYIFCTFYRNL